jgi:hypothetical protein
MKPSSPGFRTESEYCLGSAPQAGLSPCPERWSGGLPFPLPLARGVAAGPSLLGLEPTSESECAEAE